MLSCEVVREALWDRARHEPTGLEARELEAHLASCADCREEDSVAVRFHGALSVGPGELPERLSPPSPAAGERPIMGESGCEDEVLTPQEVAAYLKVPVEDVVARLDELPAFEFAGRVRFRRSALVDWLSEREGRWRQEAVAGELLRLRRRAG